MNNVYCTLCAFTMLTVFVCHIVYCIFALYCIILNIVQNVCDTFCVYFYKKNKKNCATFRFQILDFGFYTL